METKKVVTTYGNQVLVSPARYTSSLVPCLHEEADTKVFVHEADVASRNHKEIIIRTIEM